MSNKTLLLRERLAHFRGDYAVLLILLLSLSLNVVLGLRLSASRFAPRLPFQQIALGSRIGALRVRALDGAVTTLEWAAANKPSVVYVFTPTCHWCKQNLENIRALATARDATYRFIGLSLTDANLIDYCRAANIPFPVFSIADRDTIKNLHLGSTPETLVISRLGEVTFAVTGAYAGKAAGDMERFFGFRLPGLVTQTSGVAR